MPVCDREFDALVIGGGVAGLVTARDLARAGQRVGLVERGPRLGGRVRGSRLAGLPVELGAEAFATRTGDVHMLLAELGLGNHIVAPRRDPAWVITNQAAHPLPESGVLGIPARPLSAATIRAIGFAAACRVACEPWRPRSSHDPGASVASVTRDRLGVRALTQLVAPVTEGVYSASPETLPFAAQAELAAAYERSGSLVRAAREVRASRLAAGGAVASLTGGMQGLIAALDADLRDLGVTVVTDAPVDSVAPAEASANALSGAASDAAAGVAASPGAEAPSRWRASWAGGSAEAAAIVLAIAPREATRLLAQPGAAPTAPTVPTGPTAPAAPTAEIAVETVTLVVDEAQLDQFPRGTGALIRPGHPRIAAKALTHATAKWAWLRDAAPAGRHVLRLSYGTRGRSPATAPLNDVESAALALRDAGEVLGVPLAPASLVAHERARWVIPGRADAPQLPPGLFCTGEAVAGTGLASVVPHARRTARDVLARQPVHQRNP
ncbi:oxygen-dependent protoporphyrinogen oxidase [Leucobacter exalbidus]|uniref:Oxygen-dependent protoporphyrinogen oxidase n=1 Tax=Leucobacter exalbidus TaxID=662960 RepID=A0A940PPZ1_9MICO|nr:oxygen-dependent protoporphyrinogen oxidase [Leucobacter exalbidus]